MYENSDLTDTAYFMTFTRGSVLTLMSIKSPLVYAACTSLRVAKFCS